MRKLCTTTLITLSITLLAGLVASTSLAAEDEDVWQLFNFQEREILAKIGITEKTSKEKAIATAQNALMWHRDAAVRATCAKLLGRFEAKSARDALISALKDPNADVRRWSAQALGVIGEWQAIEPLGELLNKEPSGETRKTIVIAMRAIGDRRAAPILAATLVKDPEVSVRMLAATTLGELKDTRAWQQLVQALSDTAPAVRKAAALALGLMQETRALDKLIELLGHDDHVDVRGVAARALGQLGKRKAVQPLIEGLNDPHPYVRRLCAGSLGLIGSSKALKPLKHVASNDPDPVVRKTAQAAFNKIKNQ